MRSLDLPSALRRLLLVLAVSAGLGSTSAGQERQGVDDPRTAAEAVLASIQDGKLDLAVLRTGLETVGATAPAGLFEILLAGELPGASGQASPLSRAQEFQLLYIYRTLPREQLLAFLGGLKGTAAESNERQLALRILGESATGADTPLALELARGPSFASVIESEVTQELETTLGRIFRREPDAVGLLPSLLTSCPTPLRYLLVRTVARTDADGRLAALSRCMGRVPALDPIVLVEIRRVVEKDGAGDELSIGLLRPYLLKSDPSLVVLAIQALSAQEDHESVPTLVVLLAGPHSGVNTAAHRALVELTGITWDADPKAWAAWREDETRWWRNEAPGCADDIAAGHFGRAGAAIVETLAPSIVSRPRGRDVARGSLR